MLEQRAGRFIGPGKAAEEAVYSPNTLAAGPGLVLHCPSPVRAGKAIVTGLRARGVKLAVERVAPIRTDEYPAKARRPLNSRLSMDRRNQVFGITPPHWESALAPELDVLGREMAREGAAALANRAASA